MIFGRCLKKNLCEYRKFFFLLPTGLTKENANLLCHTTSPSKSLETR